MLSQKTLDRIALTIFGLFLLGCAVTPFIEEAHIRWEKSYVDTIALQTIANDDCVKKWSNADLKEGVLITNKRLHDLQTFCGWQRNDATELASRSDIRAVQLNSVN